MCISQLIKGEQYCRGRFENEANQGALVCLLPSWKRRRIPSTWVWCYVMHLPCLHLLKLQISRQISGFFWKKGEKEKAGPLNRLAQIQASLVPLEPVKREGDHSAMIQRLDLDYKIPRHTISIVGRDTTTTMNSGTGIQELMAAETRASQIVAEARIGRFS